MFVILNNMIICLKYVLQVFCQRFNLKCPGSVITAQIHPFRSQLFVLLDNAIHRITNYPVDNEIGLLPNTYPLDSDLSCE